MGTKTAAEIIQAHKRTIEVYTGQECTIILTDRVEASLKRLSLSEILLMCEKYNATAFTIDSKSRLGEVVDLRKMFCLLANKAGYSARKTAMYLSTTHPAIMHLLREGERILSGDDNFKRLYNTVLSDLVDRAQKLTSQ